MKSSNWSTYWCLQVSFFILVISPGASSSLAVAVPESCSMKEENKVDWKTDRNTHRKHVAGCNFVEKETSTQVLFWILLNYLEQLSCRTPSDSCMWICSVFLTKKVLCFPNTTYSQVILVFHVLARAYTFIYLIL